MKINVGQYERDLIAITITEGGTQRRSQVFDGITPEMFKDSNNRRCWSAMRDLNSEGEEVDGVGVPERMGEEGDSLYLMEIVSGSAATKSQLIALAKRVRQSAYLQDARDRLLDSLAVIDNLTDVTQAKTVAASIQDVFDSLLLETSDRKPMLFKDVVKDYVDKMQDKINGKEDKYIVKSGIPDLDYHTGGFNKTDLLVWAGLSGSGKTEGAVDIIRGVTSNNNVDGALMFSLEMSNNQVVERAIGGESSLPISDLRNPKLLEEGNGWERMKAGLASLVNRQIFMEDQSGLSVQDIIIRSKRHVRDHPETKIIVVDHIGLMKLGKNLAHHLALGDITRELKSLAKEIEVPVLILSQVVGKQIMQRPLSDRIPRAQDIKDSSRIEEDADLIVMTHRQQSHDETAPNIAEWVLVKARHAIKGTKVYHRFVNGHFCAMSQEHAKDEMNKYYDS